MKALPLKLLVPFLLPLIAACSAVSQPSAPEAKLFPGLDSFGKTITTESTQAQAYFNQGITLLYGFNHEEAFRSFEHAARFDPEAAMAYWGMAYSVGMNINDQEMTDDRWQRGWHNAEMAMSVLDNEQDWEKALVEALSHRYVYPAPVDKRQYDEAYAQAMRAVYANFGEDPDIACLFAESLMDLQPWDYWTIEGKEPKGEIETVLAALESALEKDPQHPGAAHFYIHAMEAGPNPAKAVPFAEDLEDRIPGSGHLVHMPSHIYVRVGRYDDAAEANVRAVAADKKYFSQAGDIGMYLMYYGHNQHFLAYASMMGARYDDAIAAARELIADMPEGALIDIAPFVEGIMATDYHVMVRFGKWEEILEMQKPEGDHRKISRAVHHYARGIALAVLGKTEEARQEQVLFLQERENVPDDWLIMINPAHDVLPIAEAMLEGEIAYREGRLEEAWEALQRGIEAEDRLIYDEPPAWMLPVRHSKGALMLEAGLAKEAELLYREDQERHPGNGWSLLGLSQALAAQGKMAESAGYAERAKQAWKGAEVMPTSSCMCAP